MRYVRAGHVSLAGLLPQEAVSRLRSGYTSREVCITTKFAFMLAFQWAELFAHVRAVESIWERGQFFCHGGCQVLKCLAHKRM